MNKKTILSLLSVVFLGLGSVLLEAKYNGCGFYIQNNTDGKIAVQTFDEMGNPVKMVEIRRGKRKGFKKMLNVLFELSSKPHRSRNDYMPFGQFRLSMCPDTKMTFDATDFMNYSGMVPEYFASEMGFKEETMMTETETPMSYRETEYMEMETPEEEEIMFTEQEPMYEEKSSY